LSYDEDSKRFADSGGWRYAELDYDAAVVITAARSDDACSAPQVSSLRCYCPQHQDQMDTLWYALAAALILTGLVGAVVPVLPGIPLIFGGIWLIAHVDQYHHLGPGWLVSIALVGAVGLTVDLVAGALGAKRVGASPRAVWGALLGTVVGLFFGLPGLLLGPFFGAVLGELSAGNSILRSTHVGASASIGLLIGALIKLVASVAMVALFGAGWWWNRP
jgi:uncharacterized protein